MLGYSSKLLQLDAEMLNVVPREGAQQPAFIAQVTHSLLMGSQLKER